MINDGRKSFRKSAERTPPFFMTLVFLMLREVERLGYFSRNSFGGLFSGRLDQSQIQSAFFFIRFSTSRLLSWKSSSDCELFPSEPLHIRRGVCALSGLLHWELPLELLLPDSCCASSSIFSMSTSWMDVGICSWLPWWLVLWDPVPLKCSSTQEPCKLSSDEMSFWRDIVPI